MTTVRTQAELDAALARGDERIDIRSKEGIWLEVSSSATVTAYRSATVTAYTRPRSGRPARRRSGLAPASPCISTPVAPRYPEASLMTLVEGHLVLIDHTHEPTSAAAWCAWHGVEVTDGIATLYKAVSDEWTTDRGTSYAPGSTPEAPDWRDDHDCGGGLHFSPSPMEALQYNRDATRFLAVGVEVETLRPILGDTPKAKAPRVVVACREVDIDGAEVTR